MSVKVLLDTYGHHHPDYMRRGRSRPDHVEGSEQNVSLVVSLVEPESSPRNRQKT